MQKDALLKKRDELLKKRRNIDKKMYDIEKILGNKCYTAAVDFSSMYPSIFRLLNISIENLVGFLDNDPIAYRNLGLTDKTLKYEEKSKELLKTTLKNTKFKKFVKDDKKVALRLDIYNKKFENATIEEIAETPFEKYFLSLLIGDNSIKFKFQNKEFTAQELQEYLKKHNLSISGSGAIFKNYIESMENKNINSQGLVPNYLAFLFKERKKVKKDLKTHYKRRILLEKFKNVAIKNGLWEK
jgi:DNA polymerase elongation subunit (family B)